MEQHTVHKSVVIKAPPSAVWDALTNPKKTKEYFFNCEVLSDWQPGSSITFKGKMFWIMDIEMKGNIVEVVPEKKLKYTLNNEKDGDKPASTSTVTDELVYANGETTVYITDDVGEGEGAEKRYERSEKGWDKILSGLKELVEKEQE